MHQKASPYDRPQPHYFGAGPALLPTEVLQQASKDLINYQGLGIGLAEISHRSKEATEIINTTKEKLVELLSIPDTHEVFFAQGGGTAGFAAIACNMMAAFASKTNKKGKADYIVTGSWSQKAVEEAQRLGIDVNRVVDAKKSSPDGKYGTIPDESQWKFSDPSETAYVYYCDNETVSGVEFPDVPKVPQGVELVADMSSNFLSRKLDVSKFGIIFGGAQKNIGIAGISLYIIKKSLLERNVSDEQLRELGIPVVPICLDFPTIVKNNSVYNTLSIFALYIIQLNVDYVLNKGGLEAQELESRQKAEKIYNTLEKNSDVYTLLVDKPVRSRMNIVFRIPGEGKEEKFLKEASIWGMTGLKGHRSVGGMRVSNYNAVSPKSVDLLVDFMNDFAQEARKA